MNEDIWFVDQEEAKNDVEPTEAATQSFANVILWMANFFNDPDKVPPTHVKKSGNGGLRVLIECPHNEKIVVSISSDALNNYCCHLPANQSSNAHKDCVTKEFTEELFTEMLSEVFVI